jgi:carotenoid cleavage dioxygenase-like enzyme
VRAFHIKDGKTSYYNRWVRTAKFNMEAKEGWA